MFLPIYIRLSCGRVISCWHANHSLNDHNSSQRFSRAVIFGIFVKGQVERSSSAPQIHKVLKNYVRVKSEKVVNSVQITLMADVSISQG